MGDTVCRAITFINYNMPIRNGEDEWPGYEKYCTTGFFDCMYTKSLECEYEDKQLEGLWTHGIECITRGEGRYTHQSVFCFSRASWNTDISDLDFWSPDIYADMLLTFVVFVQTRDYIKDVDGMEMQCGKFNRAALDKLEETGHVYTYGTVDKNDFVVCIRSSDYKKAVNAIMNLHEAGCSVVYSYSVFGISEARQKKIGEEDYKKLNEQEIDSISLKGVTNSVMPNETAFYSLDIKYTSFCKRLVEALYQGKKSSGSDLDYKIYDILGDNDFRLIARMVPLGNLIRQFRKGGLLSYYGNDTQFTFFSTHLVLNTLDLNRQQTMFLIEGDMVSEMNGLLQGQYKTEWCKRLKSEMDAVVRRLDEIRIKGQYVGNLITACYGIYQLLQSLTALEAAPTKKYDFYSIYYPLETLVHILKERCCNAKEEEALAETESLAENELLYEFIHKISMTLHGTLRTDIQFFQIRDFNATLHYAPAKLRAYYTLFVFMLSAHIKEVGSIPPEVKKHSYIFCPGMFKCIGVKQLFHRPEDEKRLMLITVPERYLYFPTNLSIILAHEVGHMASERLRKRQVRHKTFLECSYRILCLELTKLAAYYLEKEAEATDSIPQFTAPDLRDALLAENNLIEDMQTDKVHMHYSELSIERTQNVYQKIHHKYARIYCAQYGKALMEGSWKLRQDEDGKNESAYSQQMKDIRSKYLFCDFLVERMIDRWYLYNISILGPLLKQLHYVLSEPVSDILAILIYGLSPREYLHSVADERKEGKTQGQTDMGITKVRIALVIAAMEHLQKTYKNGEIGDVLKKWIDVYKKMDALSSNSGTAESVLTLEANDYIESLQNKLGKIQEYQSPVDQEKNVVAARVYDYLNDKEIFEKLKGYLLACGEEYVLQLAGNSRYVKSRAIIEKAFQRCAGDSPVDLMEQVDVFLYRFENEWKDAYFGDN